MLGTLTLSALTACGGAAQVQHASPDLRDATIPTLSTSTTRAPIPSATRASRSRSATTAHDSRGVRGVVPTGDFWRHLANCECSSGHCSGPFLGYFQFSTGTARAVGWFGPKPQPRDTDEWTYAEQLAMAQEWARRIHPREGTRSGWPICWWVAQRNSGGGSW